MFFCMVILLHDMLTEKQLSLLEIFQTSCRRTMLEMLKTSQSGHPGGSLSALTYLSVLYAFRAAKTNEPIVVSNGHISPGVYAVLAELGVVDKEEVQKTFRQIGSVFEGHITRHIPGIPYGTGPLGVGVSVAAGMALANRDQMVWGSLGDGEAQEGQVHEMALLAAKEKLGNLAIFVDYNQVQLTDSLEETCPINISGMFLAHGWNVLEIDGHDGQEIWKAIENAEASDKPTLVMAKTIMGHGVPGMEEDGQALKSTWHGKAPKPEVIDEMLSKLELTDEEQKDLAAFVQEANYQPAQPDFVEDLTKLDVKTGTPRVFAADELTDCRSAYGKALLDLAQENKDIIAGTADLGGSVMTKFVAAELPEQFIEFGICEQNMVSAAGGLSIGGKIPFVSTFGAFMTSRAKDQARVNDINRTNVKMVSTHCGLSVGEDGPTHQAIDDMGSMLGLFHTHVVEPADPNHCDRIIRYAASHYGNFYVRMGRHKLPILTKEDGSILFDADYEYEYGKTEILREGEDITIVATGACVTEALKAREESGINAEIVIVSSIKQFDETLAQSLAKTGKVITVEDHNSASGLGSAIAKFIADQGIVLMDFCDLSVKAYQLSGKPNELYAAAGIDAQAIIKALKAL